uniref:Uncharacterized protein n=1 Tax=Sciurus vulgaris TaxID=55149 RepID=A0A8D2DFY4_SCIVU
MTLEEFSGREQKTKRMDKVGLALEEVLSKALGHPWTCTACWLRIHIHHNGRILL